MEKIKLISLTSTAQSPKYEEEGKSETLCFIVDIAGDTCDAGAAFSIIYLIIEPQLELAKPIAFIL